MDNKEFLPCPFCGSKDIKFATENGKAWAVVCQVCAARVGGRHLPDYAEEKEMQTKWNTRINNNN